MSARERGIIFSAPMVRALLDGRKTQTRRICKPAIDGEFPARSVHPDGAGTGWIAWWGDPITAAESARMYPGAEGFRCPYGQPGDRLWVRETFIHEPADYCWEASVSIPCRPASTVYRADCEGETRGGGWTSPLFMPRNLSRLTLEVTGVRVERLQAISAADAWAEGIPASPDVNPIHEYAELWDSINSPKPPQHIRRRKGRGKPTEQWDEAHPPKSNPNSWDANPWVWAISFRRLP